MQTPPPPPSNDPFSPLIEAWQQAFLKTLHDPQAAESLWQGWSQLAGQWANAYTSSPYGSVHPAAAESAAPQSASAGAASAADTATHAAAAASGAGVAEFAELVHRIARLEQRMAALEARPAVGSSRHEASTSDAA